MTQISEDYVSFETAKLLKEKGFDEPLNYFYNSDGIVCYATPYNWNQTTGEYPDYSRPTLQMAMKWLREIYNVHVTPKFDFYGGYYTGRIYDGRRESAAERDEYIAIVGHKSYEEASEAAIKYCLKNLI